MLALWRRRRLFFANEVFDILEGRKGFKKIVCEVMSNERKDENGTEKFKVSDCANFESDNSHTFKMIQDIFLTWKRSKCAKEVDFDNVTSATRIACLTAKIMSYIKWHRKNKYTTKDLRIKNSWPKVVIIKTMFHVLSRPRVCKMPSNELFRPQKFHFHELFGWTKVLIVS